MERVETKNLTPNAIDDKTPVILIPGIMGSTLGSDLAVIPILGKDKVSSEDMKIVDAVGTLGWGKLRDSLKANGYVIGKNVIDWIIVITIYLVNGLIILLFICLITFKLMRIIL